MRVSFAENKYISKAISRGLKTDDELVKKGGLRKNYLVLWERNLWGDQFFEALKKRRLLVENNYDFQLMGIVAPMRAYKMVWYINQAMRIAFAKQKECTVHPFGREPIDISFYTYEAPYGNYRFIENRAVKSPKGEIHYLIPELKEFDFLLYVQGEMHKDYFERLKNGLEQLSIVHYFKIFEVDRIKAKENLIF